MNIVFYLFVLVAFVAAAVTGTTKAVGDAALAGAKQSVDLAFSLAASMAFFLGLLKVVERGGGMETVSRLLRPVLTRLFPDVPADHPAMGAMTLNLAANVLGLGNAATPFGLRAMAELEKLNPHPGTATNAMVLFLAINTSGITLLPRDALTIRAAAGSADPAAVFATTLLASTVNTAVAILAARLLQGGGSTERRAGLPWWPLVLVVVAVLGLVGLLAALGERVGVWLVPTLAVGALTFGMARGVRVYEAFVEGAREGLETTVRILPYLVAILAAVGMFRASGAMGALVDALARPAAWIGVPPEVLPLAFARPLSGSASVGIASEIVQTHGPDGLIGLVATTLLGTSETTFYVLAVYFGSVKVTRLRHAVATGLLADTAAVIAATWAVRALLAPPG